MAKINNLQALRAFAALNVALFHILGTSTAYSFGLTYLRPLLGWGGNGVDIFFVLSGFIMVYVLSNKHISPGKFFLERFLRIAPLYWVLTGLFLCIVWAFPSVINGENSAVVRHAIASIFFISQSWLGRSPLLFDGWSLEYEMLFYTFLSLGLFFSHRYLTYLLSALAIMFFVLCMGLDSVAYEFILGMLLGVIYTKFKKNSYLQFSSFLSGLILFFATLTGNPLSSIEGNRVIIYGIPAFLIIYGLIGSFQIKAGVLTLLGDASYSIYLIQVFTIPAFYKAAVSLNASSYCSSDILAVLNLFFTAFAGVVTYLFLERGLSKAIKLYTG